MNYIETLKTQSAIIANAKSVNSEKKTASNIASAVGFYAELNGKIRDREEVKAAVAKDAPCNAAKASVSKGKTLAQFFADNGEITVTSEEQGEVTYTKDSFAGTSLENLPNVTFSTLYTYVKKAEKLQAETSQLERDATIIMEEEYNMPLNEIKAALGSAFDDAFSEAVNQAKNILNSSNAVKLSQVKGVISELPLELQSEIATWLASQLEAPEVVKEAVAA